jgi:imidazoleglycerol phosphate synthase glutamine amidotransferase subunit HisH
MISICNPVVSNIGSIKNFFLKNAISYELVNIGDEIKTKSLLICGVSGLYFSEEIRLVNFKNWISELNKNGVQIVGICAGMQMLFSSSDEAGQDMLGLIPGNIAKLNFLNPNTNTFIGIRGLNFLDKYFKAYFSHGFGLLDSKDLNFDEKLVVTENVESPFVSYFLLGNLVGFQFHPERSCADSMRFFLSKLKLGYAN